MNLTLPIQNILTTQISIWESIEKVVNPNFSFSEAALKGINEAFTLALSDFTWGVIVLPLQKELSPEELKYAYRAYNFSRDLIREYKLDPKSLKKPEDKVEFRWGVYRHFKGSLYVCLRKVTNQLTGNMDIVYLPVDWSLEEQTRDETLFFTDVSQHPGNKTGQKYRFEFADAKWRMFRKHPARQISRRMIRQICRYIPMESTVEIIQTDSQIVRGYCKGYSLESITLENRSMTYEVNWHDVKEISLMFKSK